MSNTFIVSDTHFGHEGVCRFLRDDGSKLRPWDLAEEMDEAMVKLWNETVKPTDKVYHLGDVIINRKALKLLGRLNGDMVLIKGNHDIFKLNDYTPYFRDIRSYHILDGLWMSHVPMHPESITKFKCNVHGHLHYRRVLLNDQIDPRYYNVSVECIDFKPIELSELQNRINREQELLTTK
jgi:calcineurin-like phosphoesterase family protein